MPGPRGEAELQTDNRTIRVLFTNRALAEAEAAMGKSILAVSRGYASGESGVTELGQLLRVGMEAARRDAREGGRAITLSEAYEALDEVGFGPAASGVFEAIGVVLGYDPEAEADPNP